MADQTPPCPTVRAVQSDLESRMERGLLKYGVTLGDAPLSHRDLLQHAYEEALDLACYLKTAIERLTPDTPAPRP